MRDQATTGPESSTLTPREIDARHARHLLERSLSQLEKGERAPAMVSCKQAVHLAPNSPRAHSVEGLISLLEGDFNAAIAAYEKVTGTYEDGATERERLVALRMARSSKTPPSVATFVPNLSAEILRLRHAVQTAPMAEFYGATENGAAPQPKDAAAIAAAMAAQASTTGFVAPPPAAPTAIDPLAEPTPAKRRRPMAWLTIAGAALFAALFSFLIARSFREPTEIPVVPAQVAPANTAAGNTQPATAPQDKNSVATPDQAMPTPQAGVPANPAVPQPTPAQAGPSAPAPPRVATPASRPQPPIPRPALPHSGSSTTTRPAPTPVPIPTEPPADPDMALPRPRVTLPGAGHDAPEFPRVNQ